MKQELAAKAAENHAHGLQIAENIVYLMGMSFILGSLFTIFILLLLDFMQRDRVGKK